MVRTDTEIRVIHPQDLEWEEAERNPGETDPAGDIFTGFESTDQRFTTGLWQRDVQRRNFERPYDEIAFIIEGTVEITTEDGRSIVAEPGDILITPKGSRAHWHSVGRVRKFWAIYEDQVEAAPTSA